VRARGAEEAAPEEAARGTEETGERKKCDCRCVLAVGAGVEGKKSKILCTQGNRQFAFKKCMSLLESVLCCLICGLKCVEQIVGTSNASICRDSQVL
jgi:hypothetical protein